jgi:hypothetical protein
MHLRHMRHIPKLPGCPRACARRALVLVCGLVMALTLALLPARIARAATTGSLTLSMAYEKSGKKTPVGGLTVTLYRVASLDDDVTHFTLEGPFADLGFDFDQGMTAQQNKDLAEASYKIVQKSKPSGVSATSGKDGAASFSKLPIGMYLAVQTKATGDAKGYAEFTPFLICVPQIDDDGITYDVVAEPKLTPLPPATPTPPKRKLAKMGDPSDPRLWATCLTLGGALFLVGVRGRRKLSEE